MLVKITKITALSIIIFTLLFNLMNLVFVGNYDYITYKETATWSFVAIIISLAIVIIEFALAKSKITSYNLKDWKRLRISIFMVFISAFVFVCTFLVASDIP